MNRERLRGILGLEPFTNQRDLLSWTHQWFAVCGGVVTATPKSPQAERGASGWSLSVGPVTSPR